MYKIRLKCTYNVLLAAGVPKENANPPSAFFDASSFAVVVDLNANGVLVVSFVVVSTAGFSSELEFANADVTGLIVNAFDILAVVVVVVVVFVDDDIADVADTKPLK